MKKILSVFLSVTVLYIGLTVCLSSQKIHADSKEKSLEHEAMVNEQFNNLLCFFQSDGYLKGVNDYPDYYAGAYISDEQRELIVCVTDDSTNVRNLIAEGTKNDSVKLKKVKYSYSELLMQSDIIMTSIADRRKNDAFSTNSALNNAVNEFVGVGINVEKNGLEISIKNPDTEKIKVLADYVIDFDNIFFIEGNYGKAEATYYPGQGITAAGYNGTMGHRAGTPICLKRIY